MATITFENVRDVTPYHGWDPRVLLGLNAVPNYSYAAKANTLKALLEATFNIRTFIDDEAIWGPDPAQEVRIRIHTSRETALSRMRVNDFCFGTISQIAYANERHQVGVRPYKTVHIEMDSWYFENYPLGYCTGMLCHEFAVHPVGDHGIRPLHGQLERNYTSGANKDQVYPGAPQPPVTPSKAGQPDHVFAAYPPCDRYGIYQETVLQAAVAMHDRVGQAAHAGQVAVTAGDVKDLLKCYLMDIASIQATNDHRAKGAINPGQLATCYNAHRLLLLAAVRRLGDPFLAYDPGQTTTTGVIKDFTYLLASLAWSLGPNWSKSWWGY